MKKSPPDQLLGHAADNDGIDEYDNPLPDWWLGLFYLCIIWAVIYTVHYHFIGHRSQVSELKAEMAAAQARWPQAPAGSGAEGELVVDNQTVAAGEAIFKANCVACHGADMHGGIGPNLLDTVWIHGGAPSDIRHTITVGVPAKGMLTWGPILGPEKVAEVAAYVVYRNAEATGHPIAGVSLP
ncbi:MAG: cbb3-type cytochrome c oxidase N-terminal domain-containing protein [Gemmatimonadales bacterium]